MGIEKFKGFIKRKTETVLINNEVWLYTRVSSKDQEANKSLENQEDGGYKYAELHKYVVTQVFGGTFESASGDFTRAEFMKLLEAIKRSRKRPFAVLIYTMSRFSRSGGGGVSLAHQLVDELGVHLIEVSTGKNTTTPEGKLEIFSSLLRASQDNLDRLKVTIPGMKTLLKKGNNLGRVPIGYVLFGPRVKNPHFFRPQQKIEKCKDTSAAIRLAWDLKLKVYPDYQIKEQLEEIGVKVTMQLLSKMWRNPFYCGVNTNKLLGENIVKGNWDPFVTEDEFFEVQNILKGKRNGYKKDDSASVRPLTGYIDCSICHTRLKSYEVKA
jgi:predicted site-specific integrase-resolvase